MCSAPCKPLVIWSSAHPSSPEQHPSWTTDCKAAPSSTLADTAGLLQGVRLGLGACIRNAPRREWQQIRFRVGRARFQLGQAL